MGDHNQLRRAAEASSLLKSLPKRLGADRTGVFIHHGGDAFSAIGEQDSPSWEEVSLEVVRQAQERPTLFDAHQDGSASTISLGILCALAAPIRGQGGDLHGVLYADYRRPDAYADEEQLALLVETAADLASRLRRDDARFGAFDLDTLLDLPGLERLASEIRACMHSDLPLLIEGETGTGKTLLAHAIADASGLSPSVRATLGLSDDLNTLTSEFFGHEKGSFSGALTRRPGLVAQANGGVLILDDFGWIAYRAQQVAEVAWMAERGYHILELPTGQGMVIK